MRTEYRRQPGFGATKASTKAGLTYEKKVWFPIFNLLRDKLLAGDKTLSGWRITEQARRNGGYVDYLLELPNRNHTFLIEVKSQWSFSAYQQLLRYAGSELSSISRVCICKLFHPNVPIPEPVECLRLENLLLAKIGKMTVIPWTGRNPWPAQLTT
jgi:hypothetical protein